MNRKQWRTRSANETNWNLDDVDADFVDEVGLDQQTILDTVHSKAPGAFVPDIETVFLYKDYNDISMGRTLKVVTTDQRVLSLGSTGTVDPPTDGTWDALYHVEVKDPNGKWHRRQCRQFFTASNEKCFTIDRPWPNTTDAGMSFRLFQPYVVTRADVTQVLDAQLYDASRTLIQALPEGWAHFMDKNDFQGRSKGRTEAMYRSKHFQMEAPNRAPVVETDVKDTWHGPEPTGVFAYCYTYVWGKRDLEVVAPGGIQDPLFESSPSPESSLITVPADKTKAAVLTLPEIDWELNFNILGAVSAGRSGYRIRVYRRRVSVTASSATKTTIESANVYQFLAEIDGTTKEYIDNGIVVPDYHRRLPESHGYYLWRVVPFQDNDYQLDIRVRRKPLPLYNDYDAPRVDPTANEMLVQALMAKLYRKKGNFIESDKCQDRFEKAMLEYQGQFASPANIVPGIMRDSSPNSLGNWGRNITLAPYRGS